MLDVITGRIETVHAVVGADYGRAEQLRMRLAEENATNQSSYICPVCHVGVYLCIHRTEQFGKRFYFKHRVENGNCPAITRGNLSKEEIEARKYNGVKESAAHIRMKEIIRASLAQDPRFSAIEVEPRWANDGGAWRKPDVRAVLDGQTKVVFEIQLSTTFLHVIAERRLFYREQGALLCWVFSEFDPEDARMTQDDIFYNNNRNLFLASEGTLQASKERQAFMLDCHWHEPCIEDEVLVDRWNGRLLAFHELSHDYDRHCAYFYDYELVRGDQVCHLRREILASRFAKWWAGYRYHSADQAWRDFRKEFNEYSILLPEYPQLLSGLLNALYSAKAGKAVGWVHPKFISVAHTVAGSHAEVLQPFLAALAVYGRHPQLKEEDSLKPGTTVGKWEARLRECRRLKSSGDTQYDRNRTYDPLIQFLFQEVWQKLVEWDSHVGS